MRKAVIAALFAALLPVLALAQANYSDFSGGLNTRSSGLLLQDSESPSLQNVVIDKNGGVSRREGISKVNSSAIGTGSTDVNAVYQLEQSGGNKYCVSFTGTNGYYSTDGCATNTLFVSTLTANNDVNCDAYGDKLYCVNNQYNFSFNGTDDAPIASAPTDLNAIRVSNNRCFAIGKDTNPSRLYWSNLGTCDTWTPSTDYVDVDAEDGDVLTGIGPDLFGRILPYKKFSTYLLQFSNANPSQRNLIAISRSIGAKNHRNIANYNNRQYFLSVGANGGQPGVYSTDGILVQEDTGKLRGSIDSLSNFFSNIGRETIDTKADWDAGSFDPYAMSSSRDSGLMQSSYTAVAQTTSDDWSLGALVNTSTAEVSGSVTLSSTVARDEFSDGNYTSGPATWTVVSGAFGVTADGLYGATHLSMAKINTSAVAIASGSYEFLFKYSNDRSGGYTYCGGSSHYCMRYFFIKTAGGDSYSLEVDDTSNFSESKNIYLIKSVSGVETTLNSTAVTIAESSNVRFVITIATSTHILVHLDGALIMSASDSSISGPSVGADVELYYESISPYSVFNYFGGMYAYQYKYNGTVTSPIYDMAISTTVGGVMSSTFSATSGEVDFYVRQSSSPNNDMWTSWAASSDTLRVPMGLRYQQQQASLYTFTSTKTTRLDAMGLSAASTGTWTSSELFLSNTMTSWGLFQADQTLTGSASSTTFAIRASTYSGGARYAPAVAVQPGNTILASTGAYVILIGTYTIFSASETAKTDSIVINWNEGTSAKSATMAVYKNRLHMCGQTTSGLINDVCYVRDEKGAWVRWTGIAARHLNVVGQSFMAGGSSTTGGGFIYKLYDTDSDAGAPIQSYWESKDHTLGKIQNIKAIDKIYVIGSNDATTLTTTVKADSGLTSASYDLNMSTGAAFRIIHKTLDRALNGNTFRVRFENNAASKPWSIYGYGLLYRDLGLMQP